MTKKKPTRSSPKRAKSAQVSELRRPFRAPSSEVRPNKPARPFLPNEALTAIRILVPHLKHWQDDDLESPVEWLTWIAFKQLLSRTLGDLVRSCDPQHPTVTGPFDRSWSFASDGEKFAIVPEPERFAERSKTLALLRDFSDRIDVRRNDAAWTPLIRNV